MIAALFPGQNSQVVGMAKGFYDVSPAAKSILDSAEAALPGLLDLMWDGPEEVLKLTANQQPALVAAGAAAFAAYLEAGGEPPHYAAGHSLGEFSAHVAAGSLGLEHAVRLVRKRGQYMQDAVPEGQGAMAAVLKVDAAQVKEVCEEVAGEVEGVVEVANYNSPEQTVISGERAAVEKASERLKEMRARVVPLNVSAPFHCRLMKPAADKLAVILKETDFQTPSFAVLSNVTADVVEDISHVPQLLEEQVTHAVRWVELVKRLQDLGVTTFLEFGSGKVLSGLVKRIDKAATAHPVYDSESLAAALDAIQLNDRQSDRAQEVKG